MTITLDKEAEEVLQANPELTREVTAYALYLAKVKSRRSPEVESVVAEARAMASADTRSWEECSEEFRAILEEIDWHVSHTGHGN